MAATLAFQQAYTQGGARNTGWGLMDLPITVASAAGQERLVAILSITNDAFANATYENVAIDGQPATLVGTYSRVSHGDGNGNNGPIASLWRAAGTANTNINVSLSIGGGYTVYEIRIAVWTLNNAGTLYDFTAGYIDNPVTGNLSLDVDTVANGAVAGAMLAYLDSSHTTSWGGGLTERYNGSYLYSGDWISAADLNVSSGSTPLTITVSLNGFNANGTGVVGLAASFNPASTATAITASSLAAGAPAIAGGVFTQKQVLTAASLATNIPTIGSATVLQGHALSTAGITVSPPVLAQLTLGLAGAIAAVPAAAGAPVLGVASFGQRHVVVAIVPALSPPILGTTALGKVLAATGLAVGAPAIGSALLGRVLTAAPLAVQAPVLGAPAVVVAAAGLPAASLTVSPPALGQPALAQRHALAAVTASAGRPVLGTAFLGQAGIMAAIPLWIGQPGLGTPTLALKIRVTATGAVAGRPILVPASLHQAHRITALAASSGRPGLDRPRPRMLFAIPAPIMVTAGSPLLTAPVLKIHRQVLSRAAFKSKPGQAAEPLLGRVGGSPQIIGRVSRETTDPSSD